MKNGLFFLMILNAALLLNPLFASDIVNPDKPLKGQWDLQAEKVWKFLPPGRKRQYPV